MAGFLYFLPHLKTAKPADITAARLDYAIERKAIQPVVAGPWDGPGVIVADERSVVQTRFATSVLALLRVQLGGDIAPAIADGERALAVPPPADPRAFTQLVFLGRGWTVGLANEAALKMREATASWAESYPAMEYRHGPISVAGPHTLVWTLGDVEPDVSIDVEATGATVVHGELDPMAELVLVQRMAVALAEDKGLDPDHPRHLTRSVVLS